MGCAVGPCFGQAGNFTTVTTERVAEIEVLHQRASDLVLKNDFQGAIQTYSEILFLEPDDETAYTGLGQAYLILGQYKKSHEAFENALHINPHNDVAAFGIQKIMDPDGLEGMVTSQQAELENQPAAPAKAVLPAINLNFLPREKMEKRLPVVRGIKSGTPAVVPAIIKREKPKKEEPEYTLRNRHVQTGFERPGLLHAKRVQMALKNSGFYDGPVDGIMGGSTKKALVWFQTRHHLKISGKASQEAWELLALSL